MSATGWSLLPHQIFAREVYFWDNLPHELELMHDQKMYPPRFTLQVCGDKATHDATALVEFEGACEDLSTEIHLGLPTTGMHTWHSKDYISFHNNIECCRHYDMWLRHKLCVY